MKLSRRQFVGALGVGLGVLAVPVLAKSKPPATAYIDSYWMSWPSARNPTLVSIRGNFGGGCIKVLGPNGTVLGRINTTPGLRTYPIEPQSSPPYSFVWGSDL